MVFDLRRILAQAIVCTCSVMNKAKQVMISAEISHLCYLVSYSSRSSTIARKQLCLLSVYSWNHDLCWGYVCVPRCFNITILSINRNRYFCQSKLVVVWLFSVNLRYYEYRTNHSEREKGKKRAKSIQFT